MDAIELLTLDDDGNAIEGMKVPRDRDVIWYRNEDSEDVRLAYPESVRLAYPCKFFRRDKAGQPMPETLVEFLVPDYLMDQGNPTMTALRAVKQRMGWRTET